MSHFNNADEKEPKQTKPVKQENLQGKLPTGMGNEFSKT